MTRSPLFNFVFGIIVGVCLSGVLFAALLDHKVKGYIAQMETQRQAFAETNRQDLEIQHSLQADLAVCQRQAAVQGGAQ